MNGKMRRTSLSKSNVYDEIVESDKENFQEILPTNQSELFHLSIIHLDCFYLFEYLNNSVVSVSDGFLKIFSAVNLTQNVDASMSDENKTITPNLSKKSSKGVVDDKLMPPPKLPAKSLLFLK